jgi:type I restriction enzyme, S subunit
MQFKQYPSYKPSGVEWLGDVPEHWEVKPNKYVFKIQKRIAGTLGFNVLSITQKGLKVKDIESNTGQMAQDYSKYQIVNVGDFAMNHMDLLTGWIDIAKVKGVTSPDYRVFEVRNKKVNKEYFLHLFQLGYRNKILFAFGQGAAQMGRWRLQSETFNTLKMPFPSIDEQQKIVAFLDTETTRIDNLIAKQEKLIELLEEQRKSIISHAVTKGLNPNAPMKDSGVEWLGEVPEHWDSASVKYLCKIDTGNKDTVDALEDGIYPFFVRSKKIETINEYAFDGEAILTAGDGAGVGKIYHYINGKFNYHQRVYKMSHFTKVSGKFFFFYFSSLFEKVALDGGAKSTVDSLRKSHFDKFIMAIPTSYEQQEIVEYIEQQANKIDFLIEKQNQLIEKFKEYRSSIISHAVTGKIDVREFGA